MRNRKRHTVLRRWTRINAAVLVVAALAFACAPRARIVPEIPYVPQRIAATPASAKPALEAARTKSNEADIHASRASDAVDKTHKGIVSGGEDMKNLIFEVARLKSQKNASESELGEVYRKMVEIEKSRSILLDDITTAQSELECERQLRKEAYEKVVAAEAHAAEMESFNVQLRAQIVHAQEVSQALKEVNDRTAAQANANATEAFELKGKNNLKNKLLVGVSALAFVEFLLILFLIRSKLPIP